MRRHIAFVAATERELEGVLLYLRAHADQHSFQTFLLHGLTIDIIYSGIGLLQTTYTLMDYLGHRHPDVWIQGGIGGAFDTSLAVGSVHQVSEEMIVGFGAEDRDGRIKDPFEMGWNDADAFPYSQGRLENPFRTLIDLPAATGMTTFYSHGHPDHIEQLRKQPHGQIENMEGAAFFFISLIKKIPFLSIRSISNLVEARDTAKWNIDLAVNNLNDALIHLLVASKLNPERLFLPGHT